MVWLIRASIAGLLGFESLNYAGILPYTLTFSWLGLLLTGLSMWLLVELASLFLKAKIGTPLPWPAMLFGAGGIYVDAVGDIGKYFARFSSYDQFAHFAITGLVAGLFFWFFGILQKHGHFPSGSFFLAATAFLVTNLLGMFYEIEEYLEDYFTGSHRLGDGPDTANDLLLNLLGALFVAVILYVWSRFRKTREAQ